MITIIDTAQLAYGEDRVGTRISSDLYCIALKDKSCSMDYGRNHYDFDEGTMIFIGPKQVFRLNKPQELNEVQEWMLYFAPDLIRGTALADKIDSYGFFSYDTHEALHLSELEEQKINSCIKLIRDEMKERIDNHSQQVLISYIDVLLAHALRFYDRQFSTRSSQNKDVLTKVEELLSNYYKMNRQLQDGLPSIQYLAEQCFLSTYYLSDLLKKETGRTAKDHINDFIIEKAKNSLLEGTKSINEIAYSLGFNYPHHFSRLFKAKTGVSPGDYRSN